MFNDNLIYVVLIAIVGLVALTVNFIIATREQQRIDKEKRLIWLKGQAEHILQALAVLREADCKTEIIQKIDEHATSLVEEVAMLAPESELFTSLSRLKDISDSAVPSPDAFSNDKALKRAQIYINFSERLVIQLARGKKITLTLARSYQLALYWLRITMVVDAHITQGKRFQSIEDKMTALSHFRHAKALLVRADIPAHTKQPRIDTLDELIGAIQPKRAKTNSSLSSSLERLL